MVAFDRRPRGAVRFSKRDEFIVIRQIVALVVWRREQSFVDIADDFSAARIVLENPQSEIYR